MLLTFAVTKLRRYFQGLRPELVGLWVCRGSASGCSAEFTVPQMSLAVPAVWF